MAAIEKYINRVFSKRLFRKYKLLHTCRMIPLDSDPSLPCSCTTSQRYYFDNRNRLVTMNTELINLTNQRDFFSFTASGRRKEFVGRKLVGFSMEEMFDVINDVNKYKDFLPFCKKSEIKQQIGDRMQAELEIGFPPVVERYTSHIQYIRPSYILAESHDAILFNHLVTNWKFGPGLSNNLRSCVIGFYVSFEFRSLIHSQLANMFFNELVKQMESAFYTEAIRRYGSPTLPTIKLKIVPDSSPTSSS